MDWSDFSQKQVGFVGAGRENLGLLPMLKKAGARITVFENRPSKSLAESFRKQGIVLREQDNYLEALGGMDFLFRSPGIPISLVDNALNRAAKKPKISSATDLFLELSPCRTVGVTGTKGKGTTANYLFNILSSAGRKVYFAGNIGLSIFDSWDKLTPDSIVILELSSFQLEDVSHSPHIAIVLPITQDHLSPLSEKSPNYHPTLEAYHNAKAGISRFQKNDDVVIYAADAPASARVAEQSVGRKIPLSMQDPNCVAYLEKNGRVSLNEKELLTLPITITGYHRQLDASLAAIAAYVLEVEPEAIVTGLAKTKSLPHRLESYAKKDGVLYVDDSYATAPDAAAAAISSFKAPIVWIAGGSSKGASFDELAATIGESSVKAAILIGEEAESVAKALVKVSPELAIRTGATSMKEAVELAHELASEGDVVLLSPACASFGMFTGAEQRGELFQQAVDEL